MVEGPLVLEVGVGTGLNVNYYRPDLEITALDSNRSFLQRAEMRARDKKVAATFLEGDIEKLPFQDFSFDSAVTTFLFCQLYRPQLGLRELYRVLKPGGQLLLLEHVRTHGIFGSLMSHLAEPFYRLTGDHIARDTEVEVAVAGFANVATKPLFTNGVKIIKACRK